MNKIIVAVILVAVGILGGIAFLLKDIRDNQLQTPVVTSLGATGSQFHIETEWLENGVANATTTAVATTSPTFLVSGASTTVILITAGVSDFRLNLSARSTTTNPTVTVKADVIAYDGIDLFQEANLSGTIVTYPANYFWATATTTDLTLTGSGVPKTSIPITNLNAPKMKFEIGVVGGDTEITGEFLKIIPN